MKHPFIVNRQPKGLRRGLAMLLLGLAGATNSQAQFIPSNIVVSRVGDGSTALSSASSVVSLLEINPATGAVVQTIALPSGATGTRLTMDGTSSEEGQLTLSTDGRYLSMTGYDAAAGTAAVAGTASASANRVVGRVANAGTLNLTTKLSNAYSGGSIRSATSLNGSSFWTSGSVTGILYAPLGNTTATTTSSTSSNTNVVSTQGGQLYYSTAAGTPGIYAVGLGTGSASGQTSAQVIATGPTSTPMAFQFVDLNGAVTGPDVCYIAEQNASASGGGVQKWSKSAAGAWTLSGTIPGTDLSGLTVRRNGATVTIYATSPTGLFRATDNAAYNAAPSSSALTALAPTADGTTYAFRSVALAPRANVTDQALAVTESGAPVNSFSTYVYSTTTQGSSTSATFDLNNVDGTGMATTTTLNIASVSISGANASDFSITTRPNPTAVDPGSTTTMTITFTPSGTGLRTGRLTIVSDASNTYTNNGTTLVGGRYVVNLEGNGLSATAAPVIVVSAGSPSVTIASNASPAYAPAAFMNVPQGTTSGSEQFIITNTGPDPLSITNITPTSGQFAATGLPSSFPAIVAANGGTLPFNVVFTPAGTGTRTGSITIANNSTNAAPYVLNLSGTAAAPTLTSISPSSIVAGIATTVTFTGTLFANGATVNFNGQSLATTFVNSTTVRAVITAPAGAATYPVSVTSSAGTSGTQTLTVTANPGGFFEPFETATQSSYAAAPGVTKTFVTGGYTLVRTLTGSTAGSDRFNNGQSLRLTGGGSVTMNANKTTGGIGTVTLQAANYGTDTGGNVAVAYSVDGGATFYPAMQTAAVTLSSVLQTLTFAVNAPGPVRVRISNTNTVDNVGPAINVDDLRLNDFNATTGNLTFSNTRSISGVYNNVTITGFGRGNVNNTLTINGTLTIQNNTSLGTGCQTIDGPGSFVLAAGGELDICDPAGISASGNSGAIKMTGTRSFSADALYNYYGTGTAATGSGLPATVRELAVQVPGTVILSQPVSVTQRLLLITGTLNTAGQLTLLSAANNAADATAVLRQVNGTLTGNVTVQRYLSGATNAGAGYRHLTSPVATTIGDLAAGAGNVNVELSAANGYNTSPTPGLVTPFPNVFGYDQARTNTTASNFSTFDKGWVAPASAAAPMVPGRGYTVNTTANQTIDFTGPLNLNSFSLTLPNTGGNLADGNTGWHLLGNPFANRLNWDNVTASGNLGANVGSAMYIFVSNGTYSGNYRTYLPGISTTSPLIPVGQAFFVRSQGNTANTITFDPSNTDSRFDPIGTPPVQRGGATRPTISLTLADGTGHADETLVYLDPQATAGFDGRLDADKLRNTGQNLNLYSVVNGRELAINGLPATLGSPTIVPLGLTVLAAGAHSLQADQLANFPAGTTVHLRDALTGTRTLLTAGTRYSFSTSAAGPVNGRFALELNAAGALAATPAQALEAQVQVYPNPAHGQFRVLLPVLSAAQVKGGVVAELRNVLGQVVRPVSLPVVAGQAVQAQVSVSGLAAGVYQLHLTVDGVRAVRRVVVE